MLTEPVGPRSPDEILAVVYDRTHRARRRRRVHLAAGLAVAVMATTGLLSLRSTEDEARLHVVDNRRDSGSERAAAAEAKPTTGGHGGGDGGTASPTTQPERSDRASKAPPAASDRPVAAPPPSPTTTTTSLPTARLLAEAVDEEGDATPDSWYYDIVHGSMELDVARRDIVLTTRYRAPGAAAGDARDNRTMRTEVTYDQSIYGIEVTETGGELSEVEIDGRACDDCSVGFVAAGGTLTVHVPLDAFNAAVEAKRGAQATPMGPQSHVTNLLLVTERLVANVTPMEADTSDDAGGAK